MPSDTGGSIWWRRTGQTKPADAHRACRLLCPPSPPIEDPPLPLLVARPSSVFFPLFSHSTMETPLVTPVVEAPVATTTTTTVARRSNTVYWVALGIALLIILVIVAIYVWRSQKEKKPAST